MKKLAFSVWHCLPVAPTGINQAKHKICASLITRNVGPLSWLEYGFLLSAYATPFFSCSIVWNLSSLWHWWFFCAAACRWDIDCQVTAWKIRCPFSPYSVIPRQATCWKTNVGSWNQRAYICRRRLHCYSDLKLQNLAEDNNWMDSVRIFITQSILEVLGKQIRFFMWCHWQSSPLLHPKNLCWGYVENSMPCYGCFFAWFSLDLMPKPSGPESNECELASESICTLWIHIFNSRYFSSSNFNWNLWQNKGIFYLLCQWAPPACPGFLLVTFGPVWA